MDETIVFTDGASKGNPGPGGWGAVILFSDGRVLELGGESLESTNNLMELTAMLRAVEALEGESGDIKIYTDSSYVVKGITDWVQSWIINDWVTAGKKPVLHKEMWEELLWKSEELHLKWVLIPGHSHVKGNERADEIATSFAEGNYPDLYEGPLYEYPIDIQNVSINKAVEKERKSARKRSRAKAYSYPTLVGGEVKIYSNWDDAKKRVDGAPGAKYKKALSKEEEENILKEWEVKS